MATQLSLHEGKSAPVVAVDCVVAKLGRCSLSRKDFGGYALGQQVRSDPIGQTTAVETACATDGHQMSLP